MEFLSNSTRSNDLNRKAELYLQAGVIQVWFVDGRDEVMIVHRRTLDGYEEEKVASGLYHSQSLPGFWLDVSRLWARPRPNPRRCLEAILAGRPA